MKLWIRVDACMPRDPIVAEFADLVGDDLATAVGRLSMIWCVMAEHAADGWLGKAEGNADETGRKAVPNAVVEGWAMWVPKRGKPRGTLARVFRELFVADDGTVRGWAKRQGALIERMERDRERHKRPPVSTEIPPKPRGKSTSTERNGTEQKEKTVTRASRRVPSGDADSAPRFPAPVYDWLAGEWFAKIGKPPKMFRAEIKPVLARGVRPGQLSRAFTAYAEDLAERRKAGKPAAGKLAWFLEDLSHHLAQGDLCAIQIVPETLRSDVFGLSQQQINEQIAEHQRRLEEQDNALLDRILAGVAA